MNNATITMRTISEMIEEPDALDVPGITLDTGNNRDITNSREVGDNDHRAVIFEADDHFKEADTKTKRIREQKAKYYLS